MRSFNLATLLLLSGVLFTSGCTASSRDATTTGSSADSTADGVLVFGAASTTNALGDLCAAFEKQRGAKVTTSFASSSALAQQITSGAEADLFLSANVKWADAVERERLVARRVDLLGNRLVVIAPADSALTLSSIDDLKAAPIDRLALADTAAVPAGIYARQSLENMGLWQVMEPKVVAAADVRQALAYVEQGAAEAGIVYSTDAAISDRVKVIQKIPETAHDPIVYPLMLMKSGERNPAAEGLYDYLQSPDAMPVFEKYGFAVRVKLAKAGP